MILNLGYLTRGSLTFEYLWGQPYPEVVKARKRGDRLAARLEAAARAARNKT